MKIKSLLLGVAVSALTFSACSHRPYMAEDLLMPVLHAVQDNDADDLFCLQPDDDKINEVFSGNMANLGANYYNKYTRSYRKLNMETAITNDMYIINDISKTNNLNWDDVLLGNVSKENISDSAVSYTKVTASLRFPKGGDYTLSYNTIQYNGLWYLLNDVSFQRVRP